MSEIQIALENLAKILAPFDSKSANYVRSCKNRSPQEIADDVNLWGGPGSLMDQGIYGKGRDIQRPFESAAIRLALALRAAGVSARRMENWANAFEEWQKKNI